MLICCFWNIQNILTMNLLVCFPLLICFLPLLIYYSETFQKTNSIYLYSFYNPYFLSISMIGTPCFNIYILRFTAWSQLTLFFDLKFFNRIITFVLSTAWYIPLQVYYYRSKNKHYILLNGCFWNIQNCCFCQLHILPPLLICCSGKFQTLK